MRTTWLILVIMLIAGAGMYYFATRGKAYGPDDSIAIAQTVDSIRLKTSLFAAPSQADVLYDSTWSLQDSTPLKQVSINNASATFDKHYSATTFFIDYDHAWFYDFTVNKPDNNKTYDIQFSINKLRDTLVVQGTIDDREGHQLRFSGPMLKMYSAFAIDYYHPGQVDTTQVQQADSTLPADSSVAETPAIQPAKTITVLRN